MSERAWQGTWTALVTPFKEGGGELDLESLERLLTFQLSHKVDGIVVCGSTGEAQTLSDDEYRTVLRVARGVVKSDTPLIAGVGTPDTRRAVATAVAAREIGVDGVLLVTPPYVKPMQHGIIEHFRVVARESALPLVAYNIPGRTGMGMTPATIAALFNEGLICALKDSTGSLDHLMEVVALTDMALPIFSGEDSLVHAIIACGGKGVISACANVAPAEFVTLTNAALRGRVEESLRTQIALLPTVRAMFLETNPIPVKAYLRELGLISSDFVRLPLTVASDPTRRQISKLRG